MCAPLYGRCPRSRQNGKLMGSTENMFMYHRMSCRDAIKQGSNELTLLFKSAWYEAKKEEAANGGPMALCTSWIAMCWDCSWIRER
jgi:hypothetical protein